jgi:hypothetical protein
MMMKNFGTQIWIAALFFHGSAFAASPMKIVCSEFRGLPQSNAVFTLDSTGGSVEAVLQEADQDLYFSCSELDAYWSCHERFARGSKWLANPGLTIVVNLPNDPSGAITAKIFRSTYEGSDLLADGSCAADR